MPIPTMSYTIEEDSVLKSAYSLDDLILLLMLLRVYHVANAIVYLSRVKNHRYEVI
jgi:hypothetical protein